MIGKIGENRANKCRHFAGTQNEKCAAGHVYWQIARNETEGTFGCALRLPCLYATESDYPCPDLSRMTDAELKEEEAEADRHAAQFIERMNVARPAIVEHIGISRRKQFVRGSLPCPICKHGTLSYIYSGHYNGHIHGSCSTDGCVRWME